MWFTPEDIARPSTLNGQPILHLWKAKVNRISLIFTHLRKKSAGTGEKKRMGRGEISH